MFYAGGRVVTVANSPIIHWLGNADDRRVHLQRRPETTMKYAKTRDIYGTCKSSRKIASNLLWWEVNYYSNDAAEALTSQAPDG
jgi:hypothetical protein